MRKLGDIISENKNLPKISNQTQLSLPPRPQPLTVEQFEQLEKSIEKHYKKLVVRRDVKIPIRDYNGNIYKWEYDFEDSIEGFIPIDNPPAKLTEAMIRPSTFQNVVFLLTKLESHKPYGRGNFEFVLEDLAKDLENKSEWAIMKACEYFRRCEDVFFPNSSDIISKVIYFNDMVKILEVKNA